MDLTIKKCGSDKIVQKNYRRTNMPIIVIPNPYFFSPDSRYKIYQSYIKSSILYRTQIKDIYIYIYAILFVLSGPFNSW